MLLRDPTDTLVLSFLVLVVLASPARIIGLPFDEALANLEV